MWVLIGILTVNKGKVFFPNIIGDWSEASLLRNPLLEIVKNLVYRKLFNHYSDHSINLKLL